jgi:hypothetical protein
MTSPTRRGKPQLIFLDENFLYKNGLIDDHYSSIFKSPQNISVRNLSQRIHISIVDINLAIILIKYLLKYLFGKVGKVVHIVSIHNIDIIETRIDFI